MSERDRQFLRGQLANIGVFLDDDPEQPPPVPFATPAAAVVDREFVREAMIRAGAPSRDLEWLVASCPSELDALGYRAPLLEAWCAAHQGPQPTDEHGCGRWRSTDEEKGNL